VICSVIVGLIALPLIGFFIFHVYVAVSGNTTREILKDIKEEKPQENQWCQVDPSMIDFFAEITEEESIAFKEKLKNLSNPSSNNL
jgi:hypothetical protein